MLTVKILLQTPEATLPTYATSGSAGMDLHASLKAPIVLRPQERVLVGCGIALAIPAGYEAQVRSRSGLSVKHGVVVLNAPGTIDSDYRGEVKVALINLGSEPFTIEPEMRIAQMVIACYESVTFECVTVLPETQRGAGGFGSTGT
ncbi:MAG: dUTP diphosphatase [Holosporales bacterium]|jgi:dUTP pyrophosphatase|nr:dUTP diphosphatase [Holosporales bacterium]